MLLVNVGSHTINVDHVLTFIDNEASLKIVFGASGAETDASTVHGRYTLTLEGDEAEQLRAWLEHNAEVVRGTTKAGFSVE